MDVQLTPIILLQNFATRQVPIWEIPVVLGVQFLAAMCAAWRANIIRSHQFGRLIAFVLSTFVPTIFFALLCAVFAIFKKDPSITQGDVLPGVAGAFGFALLSLAGNISNNLARFPPWCVNVDYHRGICMGLKHASFGVVFVSTIIFSINHLLDPSSYPHWMSVFFILLNAAILIGCYNCVWVAGAASIRIDSFLTQNPTCVCGKSPSSCCL